VKSLEINLFAARAASMTAGAAGPHPRMREFSEKSRIPLEHAAWNFAELKRLVPGFDSECFASIEPMSP
jgi:hypothetical protein